MKKGKGSIGKKLEKGKRARREKEKVEGKLNAERNKAPAERFRMSREDSKMEKQKGEERFRMSKQHNKEIWEMAKKESRADERMKSICDFINSTENFFTASGCAGRILLLGIPSAGTKKDAYFHRKWHREVGFGELWDGIKAKTNYEDELWFKLEPFIIHVGADTLGNARKVLRIMREAGEKRGGLIVAKDGKFIAEIVGTQAMGMPVKSRGKILVDEEYMKYCLNEANRKLGKNYGMLKRLEKECRERMK